MSWFLRRSDRGGAAANSRLLRAPAAGEHRFLAWVLLFAAGLRIGLLVLPRAVRWDEPLYLLLGLHTWQGRGFTINGLPELHHSPLFPLLAGALFRVTGAPEFASNFWYVLCGTLLVIPIHRLARAWMGPEVGRYAALLVAAFPALTVAILYWGSMTEPLFLLLIYCGAWLALRCCDGGWRRFAALGVLTGLAYLARPEGVLWLFSFLGAIAVIWWLRGERDWRRVGLGVVTLAAFAVIAAPQVWRLHRNTGHWMLTGKVSLTYEIGRAVEKNDAALYDEIVSSLQDDGEIRAASPARFSDEGAGAVHAARGELSARILRNSAHVIRSSLTSLVFSIFLLALSLWGFFAGPWSRSRVEAQLVWVAAASPVAFFLVFHVQQRFFAPAFPGLLIAAAAGLSALRRVLLSLRQPLGRWAWRAAVCLLATYFVVTGTLLARRGLATTDFGHEAAGRWLGQNSRATDRVLTRDEAVAVYSRRDLVFSPRAEWPELLAYARSRNARFLVFDDDEILRVRPFLEFLARDPPPEIRLVAQFSDRHVGTTRVFELVQ